MDTIKTQNLSLENKMDDFRVNLKLEVSEAAKSSTQVSKKL